LVLRGRDCRLAGRALHETWQSAALLGLGHQNRINPAAVFRLALRQVEGLIGSTLRLPGLVFAVPDHSTLSQRAETLEVLRPCAGSGAPVHLLVGSTGLRLCGPGEWLVGNTAPVDACLPKILHRCRC
jgi:hypothetical protein